MTFIWPWVLLSLLAVPVCVFLYLRLQRRRGRDAASLGTLGVVRQDTAAMIRRRRHIPPLIFLVGVTLLAFASARPQITLPLPRMEGIVMLTFDVSASMAADDVEPTRLDAAKQVAGNLVEHRPDSARIGVVAFGEGGLVVQPPTGDEDALRATIDRLVPQSGTSLGRGIVTALNQLAEDPIFSPRDDPPGDDPQEAPDSGTGLAPAVIVLLTDGENTDPPDPLEAAQLAIDQGVRVHTVGVGTADGAVVEVDGFNLFTRLNGPVLQDIALLTEGTYFTVQQIDDVQSVYEELETEFVVEPREVEVTSVLAGVCALLFLVGGALSLLWFGRIP